MQMCHVIVFKGCLNSIIEQGGLENDGCVTGHLAQRKSFSLSALTDSPGQEFRSSLCHLTYICKDICQSAAAGGYKVQVSRT